MQYPAHGTACLHDSNFTDPKYLDKLKALITDIREDLNAPNLPFVAGQITD